MKLRQLSVQTYANGYTHWHYKAWEGEDYLAPGHFADARDLIAEGDTCMVSNRQIATLGVFFTRDGKITLVPLASAFA
jgi:hypothetical protein